MLDNPFVQHTFTPDREEAMKKFRLFATAIAMAALAACGKADPMEPNHEFKPQASEEPFCMLIDNIWFCPEEWPAG